MNLEVILTLDANLGAFFRIGSPEGFRLALDSFLFIQEGAFPYPRLLAVFTF